MANYYVRSAAAGAGDGSSWANADTTLAAALSARSAGDVFWLADDHAETQATNMTLTSPGTAAAPCRILCVNTHVTSPPTALATSATVSTTTGTSISFNGFAYVYGVTFTAGNGTNSPAMNFTSATAWAWVLEACALRLGATGAAGRIFFGLDTTSADDQMLVMINTTVQFALAGHSIVLGQIRWIWKNTASAVTSGTLPTVLIQTSSASSGSAEISGVDLSALGSGKSLVKGNVASSGPFDIYFRNCKLGASVSVMSGALVGQGTTQIFLDNCDSGSVNYRMEHYKYQGSILQEATKVRSSGASDGTTPISHKIVTVSSGPTLFSPLEGPWMSIWNDATGSAKTVTVEILHDSATALTDGDVWLEVEGLATSGYPLSVYSIDRAADAFATPANQTSSSATWTTTGLTNPNTQKLEVTFTPAMKGPIRARVCMAKSNYTVYVDPLLTVS